MANPLDVKAIIANLTRLGVKATIAKPRTEMLRALVSPAGTPHTQS